MRRGSGNLTVVISLHDVMPETLPRMEEILAYLQSVGIPPIALLVVPGRDWQPGQIERLKELKESGHELAAHGWHHHVSEIKGAWHRLHSAILSRDVAEHLALDPAGIEDLMRRSHDWFASHDLGTPRLYVPPAWALGRISRQQLKTLPFEQIEVLGGILFPKTGKRLALPMVGYEVDSAWRARSVRLWNAWQLRRARSTSRPLRIGIHPRDFRLPLAESLRSLLQQPLVPVSYAQIPSPFS